MSVEEVTTLYEKNVLDIPRMLRDLRPDLRGPDGRSIEAWLADANFDEHGHARSRLLPPLASS